ncbi:ATP-binding protein [Micromonospora tulbaghiae]|uniref:Histidine kinase-, DNA gyrase B-, and HSP90-like ATPase n=1 Tax=Micromonospora tulbaghiae TaxID=479978 RepID=A0ABY0KSY5_9ACTN|nr:ATP-binding protein [Micromonospora tulbaghiae]SCF07931.1 Histidine kinase-, DNA gyrase B-, and HSP90-like ATPase [Micromonospora tulbaghiae]
MDSGLFHRTLVDTLENATQEAARQRLFSNYQHCHEKTSVLAGEIRRDLPQLTLHDISHPDALWESADLIAGPDYPVNPLESFVLGCAFLVHDLAMSKAAFPGGLEASVGLPRWRDTVYTHFKRKIGRPPSAQELTSPPHEVLSAAEKELLRELHAHQAANLPQECFSEGPHSSQYFLIADPGLRNAYGVLIGRIAASHWWPHSKVAEEFSSIIGAPGDLPREWTIDPLKLACIMRSADVSHIDNRRAPGFLRALTELDETSRPHWIFQEKLQRPWLDHDRLVYTASQPFGPEEASAWWLCIETLRVVDHELRSCDTLLADNGRPRFKARSVGYVDDLERISRLIPAQDWFPIDASVRVSDVIDLVQKLGGEQLYGNTPRAALRELISNGADAVRARRLLQMHQSELRLRVQVAIEKTDDGEWLVVRDNGIGMSREVMSGALLDFGKSYWSSDEARRDLPGLMSSGFTPTGKFGIGFFSIFMLGEQVRVVSRRFDRGADETFVLEFRQGLNSRPILRPATPRTEGLDYGGTEVSVRLAGDTRRRLLGNTDDGDIAVLCAWLFPTMDVNVDAVNNSGALCNAVVEGDWTSLPAEGLVRRLYPSVSLAMEDAVKRIRPILGASGEPIGRAAIVTSKRISGDRGDLRAPITVDGARAQSTVNPVIGVFLGRTKRAARDTASPLADQQSVYAWASEQVRLYLAEDPPPELQAEFAADAFSFGADIRGLTFCRTRHGWLTDQDLKNWARDRREVHLVQDAAFALADRGRRDELPLSVLDDDAFVMSTAGKIPLNHKERYWSGQSDLYIDWEEWPVPLRMMYEYAVECIAECWNAGPSLAEQVEEQIRVANRLEETHISQPLEDPTHPLYREWGTLPNGRRVGSRVHRLVRPD